MAGDRVILVVGISVALVLGITTGVLIGWFSSPSGGPESYESARRDADESIAESLINEMTKDNVREFSWTLTRDPHVAGTPENKRLADQIQANWTDYGFEAKTYAYNVLLSYPSEVEGQDNVVEIRDELNNIVFQSQLKEAPLDDLSREKADRILPPFNAYSARGTLLGDLVYVNYATVDDFHYITRDLNISVENRIVIARYGRIYRGDKAKLATEFGAAGLILYSDPADYAVPGGKTYPEGPYLPGTGTQRGSCLDGNGDPLTQSYPAVESAYRLPVEKSDMLPTIPIHPIGYDDAQELLRRMGGEEVDMFWRGALDVTYRYGPGFAGEDVNSTVRMQIFTENKMAYGWNVIGVVKGSVEPDRYVLMGNHRDAWGFGAIDAGSGTAAMLEISRSVGVMLKQGWKPRRSIMFCSWGAEEQGLIGSTEWVEEFAKTLAIRAVAYLNLDVAMSGTYVPRISATPNMNTLIYEATKKIPDPYPEDGRQTMYDTWSQRAATDLDGVPTIGTLGSGSDYAPFVQIAGISAMDFGYTYNFMETPVSFYPTYHSVYETFELVDNYYDYAIILAAGRLYAVVLHSLVDSVVLPLDAVAYADAVDGYWMSLRDGPIGQQMAAGDGGIDFQYMNSAVSNFSTAAAAFSERLENLDTYDLLAVRRMNDQLTYLERSFIDPMGLTGRPTTKHVVFAPSSKNAYAGEKFAGIVDAMFDIEANEDPEKWDKVRKELSIVTYFVQSAAYTLEQMN